MAAMFGDEFVLRKSSVFRCIAHQFSDRLLVLSLRLLGCFWSESSALACLWRARFQAMQS